MSEAARESARLAMRGEVEFDRLEAGGRLVPRIAREYWTARQRQGHSLHELSYRACFKAELPAYFIRRFTRPGDVVFDPFMGRGTAPLEAALRGRVPWGNDANPLARLLLEPRLDPPEPGEVELRLLALARDLRDPGPEPGEPELEVFFHPRTLGILRALRRRFLARERDGTLDRADRWLRMVATNRLTGHSKGFFSVRTMPPNQAVSLEAQRKLNARQGLTPPERDVYAILLKKTRSLLRDLKDAERAALAGVRPKARFTTGDARDLRDWPPASVRLVVTSPPFLDVVDYAQDNWLRCWFNGLDARAIGARLSTHRKLADWSADMRAVFDALHRLLAPGGVVAFEVGEVRRGRLRLEESVLPAAIAAGFAPLCVLVNRQRFTKTANCWGVTNNAKGTNTNRLVVLRRPARG